MSVLCGDVGSWALGSCGAVQLCSLRTGLDLLTASLQTVGGRHLLRQFHHSQLISSQTLIHFLFLERVGASLHLRIDFLV